jgi:hypothetical protein
MPVSFRFEGVVRVSRKFPAAGSITSSTTKQLRPTKGERIDADEESYRRSRAALVAGFPLPCLCRRSGEGASIYLIPALGGAERKLAEAGVPTLEKFGETLQLLGSAPWKPDGQELLFSRGTPSGGAAVWSINITTRQEI